MDPRMKTILVSAAVVALIYIGAEYYIKPKVGTYTGVKVK